MYKGAHCQHTAAVAVTVTLKWVQTPLQCVGTVASKLRTQFLYDRMEFRVSIFWNRSELLALTFE